ncbi:MAG: glutaredoxin 3 [Rickettsiaceae bacterium]|nr:glutaredoxin 3 [Rickettsiaceae bacterium]
MSQIEIYTTTSCPYCVKAKHLLKLKNLEFTEINLDHGKITREELKDLSGGRTTVPQIFINGAHIGGSDDLYELEKIGELDKILGI